MWSIFMHLGHIMCKAGSQIDKNEALMHVFWWCAWWSIMRRASFIILFHLLGFRGDYYWLLFIIVGYCCLLLLIIYFAVWLIIAYYWLLLIIEAKNKPKCFKTKNTAHEYQYTKPCAILSNMIMTLSALFLLLIQGSFVLI